jgi:hypothetical protein
LREQLILKTDQVNSQMKMNKIITGRRKLITIIPEDLIMVKKEIFYQNFLIDSSEIDLLNVTNANVFVLST